MLTCVGILCLAITGPFLKPLILFSVICFINLVFVYSVICWLGLLAEGWDGVIRVVFVVFMAIIMFILLVMGHKVALIMHTLAHYIDLNMSYDHDLGLGVHLFVQEVCTIFL